MSTDDVSEPREPAEDTGHVVVLGLAQYALPVPVSIALLCVPRTRRAASGFVTGLAIGALALTGAWLAYVVPASTA